MKVLKLVLIYWFTACVLFGAAQGNYINRCGKPASWTLSDFVSFALLLPEVIGLAMTEREIHLTCEGGGAL